MKDFLKYRTYNPSQEGFGNPSQWRSRFRKRMGYREAKEFLSQRALTPFEILGVDESAAWEEIRKAYRKLIFENHPDRGGSEDRAKEIIAAFTILEKKYG